MVALSLCFGLAVGAGVLSGLVATRRWGTGAGLSRRTAIGTVAAVGGGAFGLILLMVRAGWGFTGLDRCAARFAASHATGPSTHVLRIATDLGVASVVIPLAAVVGLAEAGRRRSWLPVAFLAVVVGGEYALANLIKVAVDRARPDVLRLTAVSGPSFPSGHATSAAAVFAALALLLVGRTRSPGFKAVLIAISVGVAVLVAATRVLLGVHWVTDVLAGLILGWTWLALASIALGSWLPWREDANTPD